MADFPCNNCQNYDPILRGSKEGRHGRCAVKSTYPAVEQKGQVFPPGVARAEPGELAKPLIVVGAETIRGCSDFRAKLPAKRTGR